MVGISTRHDPNGLVIYKGGRSGTNLPMGEGVIVEIFLNQDECNQIYDTIKEARRKYWRKV